MAQCPVAGCHNEIEWIIRVQWSALDFIEDTACDDHRGVKLDYWDRPGEDGEMPELDIERVLD